MLHLHRIEIEGFGPFATKQVIDLPKKPGVTVIYGENMRGKTSLLNAIRYAFFGQVLGRQVMGRESRVRKLHTISNRDLAAHGKYGFSVALLFDHNGDEYEIVRTCKNRIPDPTSDEHYEEDVLLRKGDAPVGPEARARILSQIFPVDVSRFFLFDGELLQEYEELLIENSDTGPKISDAIERILGVPVLTKARTHLLRLSDDANKQYAFELSKDRESQGVATAIQTAASQKQAHAEEVERLQGELTELQRTRAEAEQTLNSNQKFAALLQEKETLAARQIAAAEEERTVRGDLQRAMASAWRTLIREPVQSALTTAQRDAKKDVDDLVTELRMRSAQEGKCAVCERPIDSATSARLRVTAKGASVQPGVAGGVSKALTKLVDLGRIETNDSTEQVRAFWKRLRQLEIEQVSNKERLTDLNRQLTESDQELVRGTKTQYAQVLKKIAVVEASLDEARKKVLELDQNIQRLRKQLKPSSSNGALLQHRAEVLRAASEVFQGAVERYKNELRKRVAASATRLFVSMTTEKEDYTSLRINDSYGLTIHHRDGRAEEARSAGAEHVVALALMGALQQNAPMRGPIVMDSPFGRLDPRHTENVVRTLPDFTEQILLLVHESEVKRGEVRKFLGSSKLVREYELERISSRRTNIIKVR